MSLLVGKISGLILRRFGKLLLSLRIRLFDFVIGLFHLLACLVIFLTLQGLVLLLNGRPFLMALSAFTLQDQSSRQWSVILIFIRQSFGRSPDRIIDLVQRVFATRRAY